MGSGVGGSASSVDARGSVVDIGPERKKLGYGAKGCVMGAATSREHDKQVDLP